MRIEIDRKKLGQIVLVLQGGGGLGSYQAGVYWSKLYSTIRRAAAPSSLRCICGGQTVLNPIPSGL